MHNILVVDDELSIRESFSLILEGKYRVLLAASGEAALKTIADQKVDLAYLDIRMPGMNGLETLKRLREIDPSLEIIMVTAVNEVQKASEAVKHGARDYVVKPFDVDHITKLTEQTLRKKAILEQGTQVQKQSQKKIPEVIGQSEKIIAISKIIDKIKKDERVLILGEAGTEKESIAQIIHERSKRSSAPYKAIYLSPGIGIPRTKTILFGWERGASSVELEAKSGLLEQAKNGTLFIDNLESLPEEIFKSISSGEFSRQGGSTKIPISTRLIGGTALDLARQNKTLFDFFSEIQIQIPPLRERSSDIPLLVEHFAEKFNVRFGNDVKIKSEALEALSAYSWPGNTQQLQGLLERLILSSTTNQINLEDLPFEILVEVGGNTGSGFIADFEKSYIRSAFEQSGKNKEKTAALLGINSILLETKL